MTTHAPRPVPYGQVTFNVSVSDLARAFTEWDRRYRNDPEKFMSEAEHLLKETPNTYGDACAPYFAKLLEETKIY